jgi:hypothetical protein
MAVRSSIQKMDAQRRYAWCRFYEECSYTHKLILEQNKRILRLVNEPLPQYINPEMELAYIKKEMEDITYLLSNPYNCPICIELIPKGELDITNCGHKYCKKCLTKLKEMPEPKCAICRTELYVLPNKK